MSFVDVEEGVVTKRLKSEGSPGGEEEIVRHLKAETAVLCLGKKREVSTKSGSSVLHVLGYMGPG